jgi:predicted nucleotidyltransferase
MVATEVLDEVCRRLVAECQPERIILLGSQGRGTADEHSDIDLLVIAPLRERRRDMVWKMDRSLYGMGLDRDIVLLTPEEFEVEKEIPGTIARPAFREGRVLYARPD